MNLRKKIEILKKKQAEEIEKTLSLIVEKLKDKAERISIFGSVARGEAGIFSDLDILIIMKTNKPFLKRLEEIYSIPEISVDVDIICYTPEEFEQLKKKGFLKKILQEEKVLYDKKNRRS
ncbi:MAG: putative nucleotidyltransferase MJ0435 [Thermodesulfobacteria bacterium]|nr:nucleotidyltransferase domain-containing protein [Thermodesulfobacteriota bacterium]MCU4138179.1 putative nucleotidyltransferase MJ0435 [Thermodesulfobacteriota bacterium]